MLQEVAGDTLMGRAETSDRRVGGLEPEAAVGVGGGRCSGGEGGGRKAGRGGLWQKSGTRGRTVSSYNSFPNQIWKCLPVIYVML